MQLGWVFFLHFWSVFPLISEGFSQPCLRLLEITAKSQDLNITCSAMGCELLIKYLQLRIIHVAKGCLTWWYSCLFHSIFGKMSCIRSWRNIWKNICEMILRVLEISTPSEVEHVTSSNIYSVCRLPMNYIALLLSFIISCVIMVTWRDPKNADGTSNTGR